jgi:hypothetical protein
LLESTERFLQDHSRNRFDVKIGTLEVSSIFDWYEVDFTQGWRGYDSLHDFFRTHADWIVADAENAQALREGELQVEFLDYDWKLNSLK